MGIVDLIVLILLLVLYIFLLVTPIGQQILDSLGSIVANTTDKTNVELLKSVVETVAIIVAGYWTYTRFIRGREETREDHPYITIQHQIEDFNLGDGLVYLCLFVLVKNEGKRRLDLTKSNVYIRLVKPLYIKQVKPSPKNCLDRLIELRDDNRDDEITKGLDFSTKDENDKDENGKYLFLDYGQRLNLYTLGSRNGDNLRTSMQKLEPNQTRQLQFVFPIPKGVEVIEAISYFEFEKGCKLFKKSKTIDDENISRWEFASVYQLKSGTKSERLEKD